MTGFDRQLKEGKLGEGAVASWLLHRHADNGAAILPAYEVDGLGFKGPTLYMADRTLITPDLLVLPAGGPVYFAEVKTKTTFTWFRRTATWQTGIDKRHWDDYLRIREQLQIVIVLMFYHRSGESRQQDRALGAPSECPSGLYCQTIGKLRKCIDHTGADTGRSNGSVLVYWGIDALEFRAAAAEVEMSQEWRRVASQSTGEWLQEYDQARAEGPF